jgi:DNA-binding NarL/FixJ family response regulator
MGRIRILLADDHTILCAGLAKLLEPHFEVVGCVEDGRALLKAASELKPDVVLLDVGMPLLNGLDAARELRKRMPCVKLVFLTMDSDCYVAAEAFRAGASAYLLKTSGAAEVLLAVHDALRGVSHVTPQIGRAMEERFIQDPNALRRPTQLTARQREVLQMLAEGKPMKEIAYILQIAHRTVRFHKYRIMGALGITTNSDLVKYAMRHSMISAA